MLCQLSLVLLLSPLLGLFGKDRQNLFAQRVVFFSSGDGGASGR